MNVITLSSNLDWYHFRTRFEFIQIVTPLMHHFPAFGKVCGAVVCAPVRDAHGMGELVLDFRQRA
jgi:hypothetical protein